MLSVRNLNKNFGRLKVLDNLSMELDPHVYGLLGSNGSGKTTLLRCMTRLYREGDDAVFYQDRPIKANENYLTSIGYLPQQFGLYRDLSVADMLRMMGNLKGYDRQKIDASMTELLDRLHLPDKADARVGSLSGGMLRRLGIGQALLGDPPILYLDEPTAGLDPEERLRFKNLIEDIKQDRLIIISTHIVEDVEAVCDRILILNEGEIAVNGSNEDIKDLARNKVYEFPETDKAPLQGDYIVFRKFEREGKIWIRALSSAPQSIRSCEPNIEDGYLCVINHVE